MLSQTVFNTKIRSARVERKEKVLGYFLGPIGVSVLASILNSYLNVYYTDVLDLSNLWGGAFLTVFPLISKILGAAAFLFMARLGGPDAIAPGESETLDSVFRTGTSGQYGYVVCNSGK